VSETKHDKGVSVFLFRQLLVISRAEVPIETPLLCSVRMQSEDLLSLVSTQQNALELILNRRVVTDSLLNCLKLFESLSFTAPRWEAYLSRYRSAGGSPLSFDEMEKALVNTPLEDATIGAKLAS
jgi:hypothetical protein